MSEDQDLIDLSKIRGQGGSSGCHTCACSDVIQEKIRGFLRMRAAGTMPHGVPFFCTWLRKNHGYPKQATALRNHMKNCESKLFAKAGLSSTTEE